MHYYTAVEGRQAGNWKLLATCSHWGSGTTRRRSACSELDGRSEGIPMSHDGVCTGGASSG